MRIYKITRLKMIPEGGPVKKILATLEAKDDVDATATKIEVNFNYSGPNAQADLKQAIVNEAKKYDWKRRIDSQLDALIKKPVVPDLDIDISTEI